jgi:hypothetical protein
MGVSDLSSTDRLRDDRAAVTATLNRSASALGAHGSTVAAAPRRVCYAKQAL